MSAPLLSTKLYIPPVRPQRVSRPRLIERLNEGLQHIPGLILVSAPAGFGKTTLVSEWLYQLGTKEQKLEIRGSKTNSPPLPSPQPPAHTPRSVWLSLDEGDNDPARFFAYLVAAFQQVDLRIGQTVQGSLQAGGTPSLSPEILITTLINDVVAYLGEDYLILVLDDYHFIETETVHYTLTFLLDHLPPRFHLVITGRTSPPLPLPRLRVRGRLTELRAADLRFTSTEAAEFLNTTMGLGLSADDVAALEDRTEGWIAGLQLAALSLQEQANRPLFIKAFTGDDRYILDYLLDEVFSRQPEVVQNFLLQTSILDRLCGSLCDAVLDGEAGEQKTPAGGVIPASGQEMLVYLEQTNLFIIPLDNKREWYRYHSLLLDLLRHRLNWEISRQSFRIEREDKQTPNLKLLHCRAARWYEQRDLIAEALSHLFAAGDFAEAARLIERAGAAMLWERGEVTTLESWLKKLPSELVQVRPKLCLYWAETMYLNGQLAAIEPLLQAAELRLQDIDDEIEAKNTRGELIAMRALVAETQGRPDQASAAIELTYQALALLSPEALRLRGLLTMGLAEAYHLNGRVVEAAESFSQAIDLGQASHNLFLVLAGMSRLTDVQVIQGQLRQASETCRRIQQLSLASIHLPGNLAWSVLLREWNQLTLAKEQVRQSLESGELEDKPPRILVQAYATWGRILQAIGDLDGAFEAIRAAAQIELRCQISQTWDLPPIAAYQAWLSLLRGDMAAATRWVQEQQLSPTDEPSYRHEVDHLILARVLLAQGRAAEVMNLLEQVRQAAETAGRFGRVIEALVLQALAYQAQDDLPAALAALSQALTLAEPEGYTRLFVDEGAPMAKLLTKIKTYDASGIRNLKGYIHKLLLAFERNEDQKVIAETPSFNPSSLFRDSLIEPLTGREIQILQLIAQGLSNAEIAEKLVLTVGTVKVHTRNIYGKLGVGSRTQAVVKAKELRLL